MVMDTGVSQAAEIFFRLGGVCAIIPRGPTLSERISRRRSIRSASVSSMVGLTASTLASPREREWINPSARETGLRPVAR
jgi:hypothetical protein